MRHMKLLISLAICFGPSLGSARSGLNNPAYLPHRFPDLHLAQSSADALSQSERKRITFYSKRVLKTIAALAAEDAAGGVASDDNVVALRAAVSRLVDAGKRSGLSQTDTADFFQLMAEKKFTNDIPLALQGAQGEMNTRVLFAGVAGRSQFGTSGKSSQNLMDHLNAASAEMTPFSDPTKLDAKPEQATLTSASEPDVVAGVSGTIAERVQIRDGQRVIVVTKGDTLAAYAQAIYGDPLAYRQIFAANDTILASPNDLVVGTTLVLP